MIVNYGLCLPLGVFVLILFLIFVKVHKLRIVRHLKHFNTIPEIPLMGCYHLINLNFSNAMDFVKRFRNFPLYSWLGPFQLLVAITDPDDVEIVLADSKTAEKPYLYEFFNNNRGLLTSQHYIWKSHRKILNPAFSINNIKTMVPVFKEKCDLMIKRMKVLEDGVDCELKRFIKVANVESGIAVFAGEQLDKETIELYCDNMADKIHFLTKRLLTFYLHCEKVYKLTNYYVQQQKSEDFMKKMVKDLINKNLAKGKTNEENNSKKMLVDFLINQWKNNVITEEDVIDELDTILYTSVDTTTQTIIYTLLMIAMYDDVQEKVVAELKTVFHSPEVPFEYDTLKQLNYMDMVIKETLRLFAIVPLVLKQARENIKLTKSMIPKGSYILIPVVSMNENKEVWGPNPKNFNPDNFLPEKVNQRHPSAFLPFSGGPRNCIGLVYGQFFLRCIIASLLMNYTIRTSLRMQDIETLYKVTLNLANKNPFRLYKKKDFWKDDNFNY